MYGIAPVLTGLQFYILFQTAKCILRLSNLLKEIVQQAWDNKESTQEQFLRTHLDSLEEKVQDAPNCQGTIYYLDEEETNALILILLKRLEVQK